MEPTKNGTNFHQAYQFQMNDHWNAKILFRFFPTHFFLKFGRTHSPYLVTGNCMPNYLVYQLHTHNVLYRNICTTLQDLQCCIGSPRSVIDGFWRWAPWLACLRLAIKYHIQNVTVGPVYSFCAFKPHEILPLFWIIVAISFSTDS